MFRSLPPRLVRLFHVLALIFLVSPAAAEDVLYASTEAILTDVNGTGLATVAPGTELKLVERSDGQVKVEVAGWSPEGGESYLFLAIGQRILTARLTDAGVALATRAGEQEDDYESPWYDMRIIGWLSEDATTRDVARVWQAGSDIFHHRCTRCHTLHRPGEFTANQWPAILKIMTVRAGLKGADRALLIQYMQTHAKDGPLAGEAAKEESGPAAIKGDEALAEVGAKSYDDYGCAGCHGEDAATPGDIAYPRLAGQSAEYLFKQLGDFQSGARANDADEVMRGVVEGMPADDMRAIAWWLSGLAHSE